jgi:hypothetical protein
VCVCVCVCARARVCVCVCACDSLIRDRTTRSDHAIGHRDRTTRSVMSLHICLSDQTLPTPHEDNACQRNNTARLS